MKRAEALDLRAGDLILFCHPGTSADHYLYILVVSITFEMNWLMTESEDPGETVEEIIVSGMSAWKQVYKDPGSGFNKYVLHSGTLKNLKLVHKAARL